MKSFWPIVLLAFPLCAFGGSAPPLTNTEAKTALEAEHAAQSIFKLQTGTFSVVKKGGTYAGPDAISEVRRLELRAWSRVGMVKLEVDPAWQAFDKGRGDMTLHNQAKQGVFERLIVTPTAMAAPFRDRKKPSQYNIPMGNLVIDKIEENVEKTIGADQYRVITFSGKINFLPVTAEYFKQYFAKAVKQEGRAIYLMKFDPATRQWMRVAADWADATGDFKSKQVQTMMLDLSRGKP